MRTRSSTNISPFAPLDLGLARDSWLAVNKSQRGRYDVTPVLIPAARGQLSERIIALMPAPTIISSCHSSSANYGLAWRRDPA